VQIGLLYHIAAIETIGSISTCNKFCKKSDGLYRALQGYTNFEASKLACALFIKCIYYMAYYVDLAHMHTLKALHMKDSPRQKRNYYYKQNKY